MAEPTVPDNDGSDAPDAGSDTGTGPPGIPSLAQRGDATTGKTRAKGGKDGKDPRDSGSGKRRRARKGRTGRRMVKIPDDDVPATPTPPAVSAARSSPDAVDDGDDFSGPQPAISSEHALDVGRHDIADAADAETETSDQVEMADTTLESESGDDAPTPVAEAVQAKAGHGPSSQPQAPGSGRSSGSGIFTDDKSIGLVRPIQVTNDLPPVTSQRSSRNPPVDAAAPTSQVQDSARARPLPPPRAANVEPEIEEIEEIVPDRMSLPGLVPPPMSTPAPTSLDGKARRPLPPRRGAGDDVVAPPPSAGPPPAAGPPPVAGPPPAAGAPAVAAGPDATPAAAQQQPRRVETKRPKRPWWIDLFEDDMVRTLDNPKPSDAAKDVNFIEQSLNLAKGTRILDLCCGMGAQAVELASRGYQVVGVDMSPTMLSIGGEYNKTRGQAVSFVQGDMRQLNLDSVFDGIYCWQASFGYFDDISNVEVLERMARALRVGGRIVIDMQNRDFVAPRSPSMVWFERPGCVCMDEMRFDFFTSRVIVKRMVMFESGKSREIEYGIRLYTLHELGRLLQRCGFRVLEVSGHRAHRGAYFGSESPRLIITAERIAPDGEAAESQ